MTKVALSFRFLTPGLFGSVSKSNIISANVTINGTEEKDPVIGFDETNSSFATWSKSILLIKNTVMIVQVIYSFPQLV